MKKLSLLLAILLLVLIALPAFAESNTALPTFEGKPRLLITQDGEVDDMNSLIHTLLYANDIDIEGIVQSSSKLHFSGDGAEVEAFRWMGTDWMNDFLDAYAEVYPNLIVHDPDYPTPDELRDITKVGNIKAEADISETTEGSELVEARILAEDPRPLLIVVGGGANTVARALMDIEAQYKDTDGWEVLYERICENTILAAWGMQDSCYMDYIQPNWPKIRMIDVSGSTIAYGYRWATLDVLSEESAEKLSGAWMEAHIEKGHGALLDRYVTWGDGTHLEGEEAPDQYGDNEELLNNEDLWVGHAYQRYDFLSEGDSPAWFLTIPNGLRSWEDIAWGGWAGRYALKKNKENPEVRLYQAAKGNEKGIAFWIGAIQSDFAMRANWCIASAYEDANHAPVVTVSEGISLSASAGETMSLHAEVSDPDGDDVSLVWYHYPLGDTYDEPKDGDKNPVAIKVNTADDGGEAAFTVPLDAKPGDTLHIILEAIDQGGTHPRAYQRVIVVVK